MARTPTDRVPPGPRALVGALFLLLGPLVSVLGPAATQPVAAAAKGVPSTSSGCASPAAAGTSTLDLTIGGHPRTVIVHVPPSATAGQALALVLNMHGSGSDALQQEGFTGMNAAADDDTFIVAYPQGVITSRSGFDWNVPNQPLPGGARPPKGSPNDVAFLTQLPSVLEQRYCVDPRQVFATGFSGGARMASQLGCDAPDEFAAIAPVSGLRLPSPCPGTRPVPVDAFHGTGDPIDPYNGHGQQYWTYSVPVAEQRWAAHDHCRPTAASSTPTPGVTLRAFSGCAGGAVVDLYTIAGEGHEWPGGPALPRAVTRLLGQPSSAIDADHVMWRFFAAHPLPSSVRS